MKHFPMAPYWWLLALIFVIGCLPIFTTLFAVGIAQANDCSISETIRNPCIIGGSDWSEWLQFGGISFWYFLLSAPLAFILFVVWLIVLLIHRVRFSRKAAA
ncbi:MAG: hypothetical protein ABIQ30_13490 [Devosia sp.]